MLPAPHKALEVGRRVEACLSVRPRPEAIVADGANADERPAPARRHRPAAGAVVALCFAAVLLQTACATNPATGKLQLSFIGEAKEISMGREADEQIVVSMGTYEDPGIQAYVERIGKDLASKSERPGLPWTFRVLDDPIVNAFALPGGFIYLTRGILAYLNSEAELATVLGHEIGHVTGKHSVNRISKSQLASFGLGVGMAVSPELRRFGNLAETGLGLLFLKYSRDDEREADDLGLRYMGHASYEAEEMPKVFAMLGSVSGSEDEGRVPTWLSTHPDPEDREERAEAIISRARSTPGERRVGRGAYLAKIDGLVFGENPRHGYFKENRFFHPEFEFQIVFPDGWQTVNQRQRVAGLSADKKAMLELTLGGESPASETLEEFISGNRLNVLRQWDRPINGLPAAWASFKLGEGTSVLRGTVAFVEHAGRVYRLLGYGLEAEWSGHERAILQAQESFRQLTDRKALDVQPARIRTVQLPNELLIQDFEKSYPSSVPSQTVALVNQVRAGERLAAGRTLKRIVGGEIP
jgi:predicted Zn-dependent protease